MNDKFKNYLVLVFCSKIVWGEIGSVNYIQSVVKIDDNVYEVATDLETIKINQHEYDLLNERVNKELSEAHNEAMQRAYFEDQNSGFYQYEQ
jgi:F0F1-type ATP synthase membrane subunit b/b'